MKLSGRFYTYMLRCADHSYYVGVTNDIDRRMIEHAEGLHPDCYTFNRRPVTLVCLEVFMNVDVAIAREKQIKKWSRNKKEALMRNDINALQQYAMNTEAKMQGNLLNSPDKPSTSSG